MLRKIIKILIIVIIITTLPYYYTLIYDFPVSKPFSGNSFYNPYSDLDSSWLKCNFHAHSIGMGGLTNGKNTIEEMQDRYKSFGYDIAALSNYNNISPAHSDMQIPAFEHGLNLGTIHQLVINTPRSFVFDYPFFQMKSHKQFIINKLKDKNR